MSSLADLQFTDLLLFNNGVAKLKGCPNTGVHLIPLPRELLPEVKGLPNKLMDIVLKRKQNTAHFEHNKVHYRIAYIEDLQAGKVWFLRRLPNVVPNFEELGLAPYLTSWLLEKEQCQGLILVSGAQASGKTTMASSLVGKRLELFGGHGVTFENPAELPLAGNWGEFGHCFQTEIAGEQELAQCIENAHRYASPDIIFIGEIRTKFAALEALRVALGSNKQIVIATIHGLNVIAALERLITWAREVDGENACKNLADALLAVVHVQLMSKNDALTLHSQEHLLLPFSQYEKTRPIRAKLREGKFYTLSDDMRDLKNKIAHEGKL